MSPNELNTRDRAMLESCKNLCEKVLTKHNPHVVTEESWEIDFIRNLSSQVERVKIHYKSTTHVDVMDEIMNRMYDKTTLAKQLADKLLRN